MPTANAVRIREAGGPEVLELGQLEVRDPGPGEVLVEIAAAGLNRADCLQRRGFYPAPPGVSPDVPGLEYAGVVEAIGSDVASIRTGDRVMGIVGGGGMASYVVVPECEVLPVPEALSLEEAAAIPEVFLTAYDAVILQAGLGLGETLLIHSVASGVGTAAIQLGNAIGATTIGTSRSANKLARCEQLGLHHGVLVEDKQFSGRVLEISPRGVDVTLDTIGAAYLAENIKVAASKGRIVVIGLMGGVKAELPLGLLLSKRARISGSVLRSRSLEEKATLAQSFKHHVLPLFARRQLRPVIDDVLPMSAVADAHALMEANQTFGKLVLKWD